MPQMYCAKCSKWAEVDGADRSPNPTCKTCKSVLG